MMCSKSSRRDDKTMRNKREKEISETSQEIKVPIEDLLRNLSNDDIDIFSCNKKNKKDLYTIGSYLDSKSGKTAFKIGYSTFFSCGSKRLDLEREWKSKINTHWSFSGIPSGLHWLIIQLTFCYYAYAVRVKKNRSKVIEKLGEMIEKLNTDKFHSGKFLTRLVDFNRDISKHLSSRNSNTPIQPSLSSNQKRSCDVKYRPVVELTDVMGCQNGQAAEVEMEESVHEEDTLDMLPSCDGNNSNFSPMNLADVTKEGSVHVEDTLDMLPSCNSNHSNFSYVNQAYVKMEGSVHLVDTPDILPSCDGDNSNFWDMNHTDVTKDGSVHLKDTPDILPSCDGNNSNFLDMNQTDVKKEGSVHQSGTLLGVLDRRNMNSSSIPDAEQKYDCLITLTSDSENNETTEVVEYCKQQSDPMSNPGKIMMGPITMQENRLPKQKLMGNIRPNHFIIKAMHDVIISIIDDSIEDANMIITFGAIVKKLTKNITAAVLNRPCFDQSELIWILTSLQKTNERIALAFVCTNLLPLMDNTKVAVPWTTIKSWCMDLSEIVNCIIIDIKIRRYKEDKASLEDLKSEFDPIRNKLETKILQKFADMLPLTEKLGKISDTCLYLLFGLNQSDSLCTDLLVKMVLLLWSSTGKFPNDLSSRKTCKKVLRKVFWCLPLACMMNLRGFGIIGGQTPVCSIDEFLEEDFIITEES